MFLISMVQFPYPAFVICSVKTTMSAFFVLNAFPISISSFCICTISSALTGIALANYSLNCFQYLSGLNYILEMEKSKCVCEKWKLEN